MEYRDRESDKSIDVNFFDENGRLINRKDRRLVSGDYAFLKEKTRKKNISRLIVFLEREYSFDGLHHYTDILNLKDILKDGKLYSRNTVEGEHDFNDSSNKEIIAYTSDLTKAHVRFYYRGKTPTLWANEGIRPRDYRGAHMPIPVLLLFKKDLLFEEDLRFTYGGAGAAKSVLNLRDSELYCIDWTKVFSNDVEYRNERNSELWIKDMVDLRHISKIIFRSEAEKELAEALYGDLYNYKYLVDREKFTNAYSYLNKITFEKYRKGIKLRLNLHRGKESDMEDHKFNVSNSLGISESFNFKLDELENDMGLFLEGDFISLNCRSKVSDKNLELVIETREGDITNLEYFLNDVLCGVI